DPVKRAYSDYLNMLRLGRDFCPTFKKAVALGEQRIQNDWGPFYHYVSKGFYHQQLSRYLKHFDAHQLLVTTQQELVDDTSQAMQRIFLFLVIDDQFEFDHFRTYNRSGVPKNKTLHKIITHPLAPLPNAIKNLNISYSSPKISPALAKKLYHIYQSDIDKLQATFDLKISHWQP